MTWQEWVQRVTGSASARQIAEKVHRSHSSVVRWLRDGGAPAGVIIDIARAYDADPIEGLIAAGLLTLEDLRPAMKAALAMVPQTMLTEEVHRRSLAWTAAVTQGYDFRPWWSETIPPK